MKMFMRQGIALLCLIQKAEKSSTAWCNESRRPCGKNILKLRNKKQKTIQLTGLGQAVSIGNQRACAELKIPIKGFTAWVVLERIPVLLFPSMEGKARLLADWTISPLLGRDIIDLSVDDLDDFEIKKMRFEPSELVVTQGRIGNTVQLITAGEAIVTRDIDGDGESDVIKILGRGDIIGHNISDGMAKFTVQSRECSKQLHYGLMKRKIKLRHFRCFLVLWFRRKSMIKILSI